MALRETNNNTKNNNNHDKDDRIWSCCSHFRVEVATLLVSKNFPKKKVSQLDVYLPLADRMCFSSHQMSARSDLGEGRSEGPCTEGVGFLCGEVQ